MIKRGDALKVALSAKATPLFLPCYDHHPSQAKTSSRSSISKFNQKGFVASGRCWPPSRQVEPCCWSHLHLHCFSGGLRDRSGRLVDMNPSLLHPDRPFSDRSHPRCLHQICCRRARSCRFTPRRARAARAAWAAHLGPDQVGKSMCINQTCSSEMVRD